MKSRDVTILWLVLTFKMYFMSMLKMLTKQEKKILGEVETMLTK